ncbi:MAG TPA: CHAD domain-containing protein [Verrucomicrobiota bacterium]|nr:CHAD domain-containing protein [Verrucomicrobiota bacterium]HNU52226.1 CHAD domain-containing protein [Verrucomicrobiota bacterium]
MNAEARFQRWHRRKRRLLSQLPDLVRQARRTGAAEQVHLLRVSLRRLRLMVRLGRPLLPAEAVAAFRHWARGISKATSRVRDLDVALEWLQLQPDAAELIPRIQLHRERVWRRVRPRWCLLSVRWRRALERQPKTKGHSGRLARRIGKLERRYERAVRAGATRFFAMAPLAQHEFRRTLRWWRYVRECVLSRSRASRDGLIKKLLAAQEATGDRQNLMLAADAVRLCARWVRLRPTATRLSGSVDRAQKIQARRIRGALAVLAQGL